MHVGFRFVGEIEVNYQGHILHINATGSNVSGYQYRQDPLAESIQGPIPLRL